MYVCVIHRQTISLDQNSSVGLDSRDASSWNPNLADLTSVGDLAPELSSILSVSEGIFYVCIFFTYMLPESSIQESFAFTRLLLQTAITNRFVGGGLEYADCIFGVADRIGCM